MSQRSKHLQWRAEYTVFRTVEMLLSCLPLSWCFHLGAGIGKMAYRTASKRRRAVIRNLQGAFGQEKSREEILDLSREVFRTNFANIISSIKTGTMPKEKIRKCLNIEGLDELQPLIDSGKGIIAILAHMGNWEMLAQVGQFACPDNPSGALYRPLNNPYLDSLIKKRREGQRNVTFSRRDKLIAPTTHLKTRGILGILTDQRVGRHGILVPFFGRVTPYTPLPDLLKRRTEASMVGVAVITEAPGKWTVRYLLPVAHDQQSNSADAAYLTEQIMRESPADCFWLHDRWKQIGKPFDRHGRHGFQSPLLFPANPQPLNFGLLVTNESQIAQSLQVANHLLECQEDLHCHLVVGSDVSADNFPPKALTNRFTLHSATDSVAASVAEAGKSGPLFVLLTWEEPPRGINGDPPPFQLDPELPFDSITEMLGATPVSLQAE